MATILYGPTQGALDTYKADNPWLGDCHAVVAGGMGEAQEILDDRLVALDPKNSWIGVGFELPDPFPKDLRITLED